MAPTSNIHKTRYILYVGKERFCDIRTSSAVSTDNNHSVESIRDHSIFFLRESHVMYDRNMIENFCSFEEVRAEREAKIWMLVVNLVLFVCLYYVHDIAMFGFG